MGAFPDRDSPPVRVFGEVPTAIMKPTYHRPAEPNRPIRRGLVVLAASVLCALGATPAAGAAPTLVIEGAGEGHGVGMSQDGALGFARHGLGYAQILAHYYTGTSLGLAPPKAVVKVLVGSRVKRVPLERYVRGVVAAEMPSSWPAAALEAQAIASRTYALTSHAGGSRFDVYADTRSQVYRGAAAETAATNAAVAATAGQIVTYAGKPAITYFFASSGGMTENVENAWPGSEPQPWLRGVADPYDTSTKWKIEIPFPQAASRLRGLYRGSFRGIEVLRRGVSPRILVARVLGSKGASVVSGPDLAARLGLGSTWARFAVRRGATVRPEPDHSAHAPQPSAPAPTPPAPAAGKQGGVQASAAGGQAPSVASSGGTAAG